jgi:hypothetical protein
LVLLPDGHSSSATDTRPQAAREDPRRVDIGLLPDGTAIGTALALSLDNQGPSD